MRSRTPKVVAFGGGHGLAATLTALRDVTPTITAVVTVADNGGSSGKIRDEFNFLPPGDLRMALAALCGADAWGQSWAQIIQHRFNSQGELNGHALGNLLLAALWDSSDDLVAGIDRVGELLKIVGRVLPMSLEPLDIEGIFEVGSIESVVRGQIEV
ncbi:MAG: gluconeogenesis factor YvcK family protein, partial [Candidatus Nanopelagicaceae bacterium]